MWSKMSIVWIWIPVHPFHLHTVPMVKGTSLMAELWSNTLRYWRLLLLREGKNEDVYTISVRVLHADQEVQMGTQGQVKFLVTWPLVTTADFSLLGMNLEFLESLNSKLCSDVPNSPETLLNACNNFPLARPMKDVTTHSPLPFLWSTLRRCRQWSPRFSLSSPPLTPHLPV